ncbi:TetR/AcrR family transcriptional regulator [Pseudomonas putida]|uniref:acrylate utilization transcriptional regulator AcuR n=1 Tax=Pseudomonas putida TaxID=303 RepID=UPI00334C749D
MTVSSLTPPRRRGRPPKNPEAVNQDTRQVLIRAGVVLLTEKGYSSVGIDEILRVAKVPKGSFYHYFGSKESFGLALIDAYAAYFAKKLDSSFLDGSMKPLERLHHFIESAKEGMRKHEFQRGCLVGNLGQEMGTLPESFRVRLREVFRDWQMRTGACLRQAQAAGQLASHIDCDVLAEFFWIGWEGAVLRAKLEQTSIALEIYAEGYFRLLGSNV